MKRWAAALSCSLLAGFAALALSVWLSFPGDFTPRDLAAIFSVVAGFLAVGLGTTAVSARLLVGKTFLRTFLIRWGVLVVFLTISVLAGVGPMPFTEVLLYGSCGLVAGSVWALCQSWPIANRWLRLAAPSGVLALLVCVPFWMQFASERWQEGDPANGSFRPGILMVPARSAHSAILLRDGRVLIAGGMLKVIGDEELTNSAVLYDPRTQTYMPVGNMIHKRAGHTATLLESGDVLLTGGSFEDGRSAELFFAREQRFIPVGPMVVERERHSANLLPGGAVLVTGGSSMRPDARAELFDPTTRTFSVVGSMSQPRAGHVATALANSDILITGGRADDNTVLAEAEIFDATTRAFRAAGRMISRRYKHTATLLADGRVLIAGGSDEHDWDGRMATAELYDPRSGQFSAVVSMHWPRFKFTGSSVLLPDGAVLLVGGARRAERFDAQVGMFGLVYGSLEGDWCYGTATLLPGGQVLFAGGYDSGMRNNPQLWIYQPAAHVPLQSVSNTARTAIPQ